MGWKHCPSKHVSFFGSTLELRHEPVILDHRMQSPGPEEWGMQSYDGELNVRFLHVLMTYHILSAVLPTSA